MALPLEQIDTSLTEELMGLKRDREVLAARLARMTTEVEKVSTPVFERVRADYQARLAALDQQAAPQKEQARREYAKLRLLLEEVATQRAAALQDQEELEFRHRLGEFEDPEFAAKSTEVAHRITGMERELAAISAVRDRFVAAFDSEAELTQGPAVAEPPAPPAPAANPDAAASSAVPKSAAAGAAVKASGNQRTATVTALDPAVVAAADAAGNLDSTGLRPPEPPAPAPVTETGGTVIRFDSRPAPIAACADSDADAGSDVGADRDASSAGEASDAGASARAARAPEIPDLPEPPAAPNTDGTVVGVAPSLAVGTPPKGTTVGGAAAPVGAGTVVLTNLDQVAASVDPALGGTMIVAFGRLVSLDAGPGTNEFRVQPFTTVGRTRQNNIQLDAPSVSRKHAQIALTDDGYVVRDLGSENGTFVNGERIAEQKLADGDHVQFGGVRFSFHTSS